MSSTIGQRLGQVISHSGKSVNQFAVELGERPDKYYNVIKGKSNPSWEMIENVIRTYPEVDGNWLLKGEGDMLPNPADSLPAPTAGGAPETPGTGKVQPEGREELLLQMIADKEKIIKLLEKQIALLEGTPKASK
jgi:hypothetical protein